MKQTLLIFLFTAVAAFPQTSTSEITGTVRDASAAVVPGASVTATNEATGINFRQATTQAGLFAFPALPAGTYTITAEKTGFRTSKKSGNLLVVGTPLTVDLMLEVGQASETVTVASTVAALQTENATVGNVVNEQAIKEL